MKLSKQTIQNIYKFYLGLYYEVELTKQEQEAFKRVYPDIRSVYVLGDRQDLLKFGKYLLLFKGKQLYKAILAYDIIFNYFNESPNNESSDAIEGTMGWFDTIVPVFIINYLMNTPKNKMLPDAINYLITSRSLVSLPTIFLTEVDLKEVKDSFDSKNQLNLRAVLSNVTQNNQPCLQSPPENIALTLKDLKNESLAMTEEIIPVVYSEQENKTVNVFNQVLRKNKKRK